MPNGFETSTATLPACPWCNTEQHVRLIGHRHFYCNKCKREFDGEDDGDVTYGRPSKRLEREERRREHETKARKQQHETHNRSR